MDARTPYWVEYGDGPRNAVFRGVIALPGGLSFFPLPVAGLGFPFALGVKDLGGFASIRFWGGLSPALGFSVAILVVCVHGRNHRMEHLKDENEVDAYYISSPLHPRAAGVMWPAIIERRIDKLFELGLRPERARIKRQTIQHRRLQHRKLAA
jgi:hypothetical protein